MGHPHERREPGRPLDRAAALLPQLAACVLVLGFTLGCGGMFGGAATTPPTDSGQEAADLHADLPDLAIPVDFATVSVGPPLSPALVAAVPCSTDPVATYRAVGSIPLDWRADLLLMVIREEKSGTSRDRLMFVAPEDEQCMHELDVWREGGDGPRITGTFTKHLNVTRTIETPGSTLHEVRDLDATLVDGLEVFDDATFEKDDKAWMKAYLGRIFATEGSKIPLDAVQQRDGRWVHGNCSDPGWDEIDLEPEAGNTLQEGEQGHFPVLEISYQDTAEYEITSITVRDHGRSLEMAYAPLDPEAGDVPGSLTATHDPGLQLWVLDLGDARRMPKRAAAFLPDSDEDCGEEEGD